MTLAVSTLRTRFFQRRPSVTPSCTGWKERDPAWLRRLSRSSPPAATSFLAASSVTHILAARRGTFPSAGSSNFSRAFDATTTWYG